MSRDAYSINIRKHVRVQSITFYLSPRNHNIRFFYIQYISPTEGVVKNKNQKYKSYTVTKTGGKKKNNNNAVVK